MSTLFPERIETDRLLLEPATTETLDPLDLYEHVREGAPHIDEITEYVTWDPHETPKVTAEFLELITEQRGNNEGATYVVRPREGEEGAGELAGLSGISVDWDAETAEFGAWFRKPFWGRGYSGERAAAFMRVAFERLTLSAVVVTVFGGNERSRKAVSRYVEAHGGRHEGLLRNFQTAEDESAADVHRFTITAEEYRDATASED